MRRATPARELERRLHSGRFTMRLSRTTRAATTPSASDNNQEGFSIVEVLVATSIMAVALTSLAQLFAVATRANGSARAATYTSMLAQQKMEQLRGLAWGFDAAGLPLSDTTTDITAAPELPSGGQG